jgi:hypothetical protein
MTATPGQPRWPSHWPMRKRTLAPGRYQFDLVEAPTADCGSVRDMRISLYRVSSCHIDILASFYKGGPLLGASREIGALGGCLRLLGCHGTRLSNSLFDKAFHLLRPIIENWYSMSWPFQTGKLSRDACHLGRLPSEWVESFELANSF